MKSKEELQQELDAMLARKEEILARQKAINNELVVLKNELTDLVGGWNVTSKIQIKKQEIADSALPVFDIVKDGWGIERVRLLVKQTPKRVYLKNFGSSDKDIFFLDKSKISKEKLQTLQNGD